MTRWLRWYEGTCEDGKFRAVARNASVTVATVMGVWAILLEDASHPDHRGIATRGEDFWAAVLEIDGDHLVTILGAMEDVNLISVGHGAITITKWKERQFETDTKDATNAERQRRWRANHGGNERKTDRNGSVTAAKRPDTDTDTEKKEDRPKREARLRTPYPEDFENGFWRPYPTSPNMSKSEALSAWKGLSEEDRKLASAAVPAYRRWLNEQKDHPVVHACRFLKQRRFEGFMAQAPPQNGGLADELAIIRRQIEAENGKAESSGGGRVGADNVEKLRPAGTAAR